MATFDRGNGEEVRVSVGEYDGRRFLQMRTWIAADDGAGHFPTKKGVTIRRRELGDFARAVAEAIRLVDTGG